MSSCKKILIIDDDKDIRDVLETYFLSEGYEVHLAANGLEGLKILESDIKPCIIILDLMMPIMNGWEFAEHVDQHQDFSKIPILVTSAFIDKKNVKAKYILSKPIELDHLTRLVKEECCKD